MKISIIGSGYVGLVTGACFAEVGHDVVCLDVDAGKIARLNAGEVPIYEPGLDAVIARAKAAGTIRFTTDAALSAKHGVLQFIAVGTPPDEDGSADVRYVLAAARTIAEQMDGFRVIVDKSTVPVGTADQVREAVQACNPKHPFAVASNPEFLKEGSAVEDFLRPDRVVIGTDDARAQTLLTELYAPFVSDSKRLIAMDIRSAELTKYAANAMLAARISLINEIANVAEAVGADVENVRAGIGFDSRIGHAFLAAGCGYGGSCFPKDVQALLRTGQGAGLAMNVLQGIEATNAAQKQRIVDKVLARFGGDVKNKTFALWGLAFKPNTDDMREAPSRVVIEALTQAGARVVAHDPVAAHEAKRIYASNAAVSFVSTPLSAAKDADALVIVTEWMQFRTVDTAALKAALRAPIVFDGRNLFEPAAMRAQGFEYIPTGRTR
jgi:UDPglucose 6-dehydrogenase